ADEGVRFRMLETLREYAAEKLAASDEDADILRRHAAYYLAFAESARDELRGPQQAAWLARLDAELPNLRAALEWGLGAQTSPPRPLSVGGEGESCSDGGEVALRFAGALWRFWSTRGYAREGLAALRAALARVPAEDPELGRSAWRAEAVSGAGALAHDL